ncbi:hypothetical protein D3C80_1303180 [compost metagenome]
MLDVIQGNEGGQGAVADRRQGQASAQWCNPAECRPEGQALAAGDCQRRLVANDRQCQHGEGGEGDAQGGEAQAIHEHDAQWRTERNGAIGGDAVPGNHPRRVLRAELANAPAVGAHADQPLGNTQ